MSWERWQSLHGSRVTAISAFFGPSAVKIGCKQHFCDFFSLGIGPTGRETLTEPPEMLSVRYCNFGSVSKHPARAYDGKMCVFGLISAESR